MIELERMREEMDEMERERSQMIAEVEAQIERALVSMAFSDNTSDAILSEGAGASLSRPNSALSSRASSRNDGNHGHHHLRSFATGTTLAENTDLVDSHPGGDEIGARLSPITMVTVKEVDEENTLDASHSTPSAEPLSEKALRRFSATRRESHTDILRGVDYGIVERTDAVAQKMLQIQQKVCFAPLALGLEGFILIFLPLHSSNKPGWRRGRDVQTP
jgi:nicotinamide N-methyltransferase